MEDYSDEEGFPDKLDELPCEFTKKYDILKIIYSDPSLGPLTRGQLIEDWINYMERYPKYAKEFLKIVAEDDPALALKLNRAYKAKGKLQLAQSVADIL